jgi:hypothetical protein
MTILLGSEPLTRSQLIEVAREFEELTIDEAVLEHLTLQRAPQDHPRPPPPTPGPAAPRRSTASPPASGPWRRPASRPISAETCSVR